MRDTLLKDCIGPIYGYDPSVPGSDALYNTRVKVLDFTDVPNGGERFLNVLAVDKNFLRPTDNSVNQVLNLTFSDESGNYGYGDSMPQVFDNTEVRGNSIPRKFITDSAALRSKISTSPYIKGVAFQVNTGPNLYPGYRDLTQATFINTGVYVPPINISDLIENFYFEINIIAGTTPIYYLNKIVSGLNSLGLILSCTPTTTTTTTILPNIPCNVSYSSGGSGVTEYSIPLDPLGGVILFQFSARNTPDKMEIIHDDVKKSTSGMLADGNSGPFDAYGEPPTNLPTVAQTYDINQFIGRNRTSPVVIYKNIQPIPSRKTELLAATGFDLTLTGSYDQFVWWTYTPSDYIINNNVIIRVTGPSGGLTGWDLQRLCPSNTTTTTSSSTSTSTSTSTTSTTTTAIPTTTTTTSTSTSSTTTTTTTVCQTPSGLTTGDLIGYCNNEGDPTWYFSGSVVEACDAFSYFRSGTGGGFSSSSIKYNSLTVGEIVYRAYSNNCVLMNDGNFWFLPNTENASTYFRTTNQINIVTTVNGIITAINVCNYVPPTSTTTTSTTTLPPDCTIVGTVQET
jgi:hypothetical protein